MNLNGFNLSATDLTKLEAGYITPELAEAAGLRRVDSHDGATMVGRKLKGGADYAGIVFPYTWPGDPHAREWRLRRDHPDLERMSDGTTKEKNKYLSPPSRSNLIYWPPDIDPAWLADAGIPVTITEGEKKTLALRRFYSERNERQLVIGLSGAWNWRGSVGKTTNSHGRRQNVQGPIADLSRIQWQGRAALIVFDVNARTNDSVAIARRELARELKRRGAVVRIVDLPDDVPDVNGVDDLLAAKGADFVAAVLSGSQDFTLSADGFEEREGGIFWVKNAGADSVRLTNFVAQVVGDVVRDDGAEQTRQFEVEARLGGQLDWRKDAVAAEEFEAMRWPARLLGARAVVYPAQKERASVAIRLLSSDIAERRVVAHTGWRDDGDGWRYYHSDGAIGATGLIEAEVDLPSLLAPCSLPQPPAGARLREVLRAVAFDLAKVAPEETILPLLGALCAAALTDVDFSLFLVGHTGSGKSELAALVQAFFGAGFHAKNLPGAWSSSANSLEGLAHTMKDCVLTIDDFCPTGSAADQARLHATADRVLRAQGNHSGRGRCRADASLRPPKPPRGLIVSTGEDLPRGQSLRARMGVIQIEKDAVQWSQMTVCQAQARAGVYAEAMAAWLQWLADDGRIGRLRAEAVETIGRLRDGWLSGSAEAHKRCASMLAQLERAWMVWLEFAADRGALDDDEVSGLREAVAAALDTYGQTQGNYQVSESPALRFIELIRAALSSGTAYLAGTDDAAPPDPASCGWRAKETSTLNGPEVTWQPTGLKIGWIEDDDIYLQPDAAYSAAGRMAGNGEGVTVTSKTLWKRLREADLLAATDGDARQTIKKSIGGMRHRVLHITRTKFTG